MYANTDSPVQTARLHDKAGCSWRSQLAYIEGRFSCDVYIRVTLLVNVSSNDMRRAKAHISLRMRAV